MYRIGEFSKKTGLTDKTLRYYESIGLLKPEEIDMWTKYREYSDDNLVEAQNIINYKNLGFSLNDIIELKTGLKAEVIDLKIKQLEEQKDIIEYQLYYLELLAKEMNKQDNELAFNNEIIHNLDMRLDSHEDIIIEHKNNKVKILSNKKAG